MATQPISADTIEAFCERVQEPLEQTVKQFTDRAYSDILDTLQDYLRENAVFNIRSKFDAQQREVVSAYSALRAVEEATTLAEAKANAYAARKGYWSPERAAQYRAEAEQVSA